MLLQDPLVNSTFNLDVSGVAGFFGGEEYLAAMATIHLMRYRRWLGWYNSPGSYYLAKKYGTLAKSRIWVALFPGRPIEPAEMLQLDSQGSGPQFWSPDIQLDKTGHLAYLLARYCEQRADITSKEPSRMRIPPSRDIEDNDHPASSIPLSSLPFMPNWPNSFIASSPAYMKTYSVTIMDLSNCKPWPEYPAIPSKYLLPFQPLGLLVTFTTIVGAILSALWGDFFCCAMILLGAISNGVNFYILGSSFLMLSFPNLLPLKGDGMLVSDHSIVILRSGGNENGINNIIKGRFRLEYRSTPRYHNIGVCAAILTLQASLQLFLVPQGKLIGQIIFLATFSISWIFNKYLTTFDHEALQAEIMFKTLGLSSKPEQVHFKSWSSALAFTAFQLHPDFLNDFAVDSKDNNKWIGIWKDIITEAYARMCHPTLVPRSPEVERRIAALSPLHQRFFQVAIEIAGDAYQESERINRRNA
ncbi:hypothetical protein BDN70DRAFT_479530 [Pholiota conissans]|uniref:Uncharacterized protein n=1 Tax=Pholiota conissans TaxID=109636 RepID=A0A9P6CN33_9AGAR|nr:hypothetical protein BDN70DRAFT_479530 [Pholiota conissans]